jgi:hypothetical protein
VIIYGVHRASWSNVGEVELVTAHLVNAEDHAQAHSATWPYGSIVVASRELDKPGELRVISVWKDGEKIRDHRPRGEWRRVRESPH